VNTPWGGVDEHGDPTGAEAPPPSAIACLNLLANPRLRARDIRVVGGVDNQSYYAHYVSGNPSPLAAGRLAVPDPARTLPVPTTAADAAVVNINRGSVLIADLPGAPWRTLNPGVYEWIELVSGRVYFNPGVYIVRGTNPVTGIGLNIIAAQIDAQNVMFYLTNTTTYSPLTGLPDASDGETAPPAPGVGNLTPSAVINLSVAGSELWGRSYAGSSLGWITVFQRRADRRPIVILTTDTYDGDDLRGVVYAKWGHVVLTGQGLTLGRFAAGTMRILTTGTFSITPATWLPPAEDVYLVE
jgi:hypothetical protein